MPASFVPDGHFSPLRYVRPEADFTFLPDGELVDVVVDVVVDVELVDVVEPGAVVDVVEPGAVVVVGAGR